jgi:signal peptidase II
MRMTDTQARRGPRALAVMLGCLVVYGAADIGTKEWALDSLSRERTGEVPPVCVPDEHGGVVYQRIPLPSRPLVAGVMRLTYAENCGAAFSMLRTAPAWVRASVFGLATVGASIMLMVMFVRGSGGKLFAAAVPFILAGALGNLSDRLRHGFVIDFLQVDPQLFVYPVFNVADIVIVVGVGLLLIDGMLKPRPDGKSALASGQSAT